MSASEKLKTLESMSGLELITAWENGLKDVLPQIVALVEEAEQFGREYWNTDYTYVAEALAALDKALGE